MQTRERARAGEDIESLVAKSDRSLPAPPDEHDPLGSGAPEHTDLPLPQRFAVNRDLRLVASHASALAARKHYAEHRSASASPTESHPSDSTAARSPPAFHSLRSARAPGENACSIQKHGLQYSTPRKRTP